MAGMNKGKSRKYTGSRLSEMIAAMFPKSAEMIMFGIVASFFAALLFYVQGR
jgi:hypothetical protein